MMINGQKMACEACIRGHRVSGCTHTDRKLIPIAKKGRPVTQCQHCRQLRKSRSAHVKCECSDKKGNKAASAAKAAAAAVAAAAANANANGEAGSRAGVVAASSTPDGESKSVSTPCPCGHGGRCTCALKKDPAPPQHHQQFTNAVAAPDFPAPLVRGEITGAVSAADDHFDAAAGARPRLPMTLSETSLVTYANQHSLKMPRHHINHHKARPYQVPTIGHTGHTFGEHIGGHRTTSSISSTSSLHPDSRLIKSEQSSPDMRIIPNMGLNSAISDLELTPRNPQQQRPRLNRSPSGRIQSGLSVNTTHLPFMHNYPSQELLASADSEYQLSAGLYPPQSAGWPPNMLSFRAYDANPYEAPESTTSSQYETPIYMAPPPPESVASSVYDGPSSMGPPPPESTASSVYNDPISVMGPPPPESVASSQYEEPVYGPRCMENFYLPLTDPNTTIPTVPSSVCGDDDLPFSTHSPPYLPTGLISSASSDFADSDTYGLSAASSYIGLQSLTPSLTPGQMTPVYDESVMPTPYNLTGDVIYEHLSQYAFGEAMGRQLQRSPTRGVPHRQMGELRISVGGEKGVAEMLQQSAGVVSPGGGQGEEDVLWMAPAFEGWKGRMA